MTQTKVTVIVVPRERYSGTHPSLASIYDNTSMPFELIYVDGGSPLHIQHYLKQESEQRNFRLLRVDHILSPNEARNLGFKHADSEYVVFIDNDAIVEQGWLERLVACADETGAWVVGPTYLIGRPEDGMVHLVGGEAHFTDVDGERHFFERHLYGFRYLSEIKDELERAPSEFVEFHCMLVRSDALKRVGPMDEDLLSAPEHIDFCLQVRAAGGEIYSEPSAVVTYVKPNYLTSPADIRFFLRRWSDEWNLSSLRHFQKKYGLRDDDKFLASHYVWLCNHRRLPIHPFVKATRKLFGRPAGRFVERLLDPLLLALTPKDQPRKLETGSFSWTKPRPRAKSA